MRRTVKKQYWLTPDEDAELKKKAKATCLTEAALTRFLINGFVPKQKPDEKVEEFLHQLIMLGNNLNKLLAKAYSAKGNAEMESVSACGRERISVSRKE